MPRVTKIIIIFSRTNKHSLTITKYRDIITWVIKLILSINIITMTLPRITGIGISTYMPKVIYILIIFRITKSHSSDIIGNGDRISLLITNIFSIHIIAKFYPQITSIGIKMYMPMIRVEITISTLIMGMYIFIPILVICG